MTTAEDLLGFENGRCYVDLPDGKGLSILSAAAADWLREQASYSISAIRGEWSSNEPHASAEDGTWEVCLCDEKGSGLHQGDIPEFDDPENFRVYESDGAFVYGEVPIDIVLDMLEGRGVRVERQFELGGNLKRNAGTLPLGFKQRLALACAVMHEPPVLFLDEPTSGVDPVVRREFWTHINGLVRRGVTVLVTTHFMDEAEYCDRISLIFRGKSIALGSPDELKARVASADNPDPTMEDAFIALVEGSEKEAA